MFSVFLAQSLHEVGGDCVQAGVGGLRFAAEYVEGFFGVDAVECHEHALGLFDRRAGLKRSLDGVGDVTCGFEAREVADRSRDGGGKQFDDLGVKRVEQIGARVSSARWMESATSRADLKRAKSPIVRETVVVSSSMISASSVSNAARLRPYKLNDPSDCSLVNNGAARKLRTPSSRAAAENLGQRSFASSASTRTMVPVLEACRQGPSPASYCSLSTLSVRSPVCTAV